MSRPHIALANIFHVAWREFREFVSSPLLISLSIVSPLMMFLLFSYGFSMDVKDMPFSYVDLCRKPASRQYIDSFIASGFFDLVAERLSIEEVQRDLMLDRTRVGIVIPEDFSSRLARDRNAEVQILVNGTNASRAVVVKGYVEGMNAQFNNDLIRDFIRKHYAGMNAELEPVSLLPTTWFNPSLDSNNYIVPGVLGFCIFMFPAMMTAIALSKEKETGMIFNVYTSPLTRFQYLFGKTLLYLAVSMIIFMILFALTIWHFRVPFHGEFLTLLIITFLYVACAAGMGLLVAVLVRTQVAALLITMIGSFLPAFLYSGFFMPVESMGPDAQIISMIMPPTYYFSILRLSFLKGVGWSYMLPQTAALAVIAVAIYGLAVFFFKKRIR
jgi:ABC-2 type transport system permease protein